MEVWVLSKWEMLRGYLRLEWLDGGRRVIGGRMKIIILVKKR